MIVEGVLITVNDDSTPNIAAMGVMIEPSQIDPDRAWQAFRLRPFPGSRTYRNLQDRPCGTFHLVDDVELLARAALADVESVRVVPGLSVACPTLFDCVRAFEFAVETADWSEPRANLECRVTKSHRRRDWIGWNRAQHAVLELTISATRVSMIDRTEIERQIESLTPLVEKTAGPNEWAAWRYVTDYLDKAWNGPRSVGTNQ